MFEHEELKEIEEYNKKYAVTRYGGVKRLLEYKYNEFESLLKFYSFKSLIDEINKRCNVNINYIHAKGEYNKIKKSFRESLDIKTIQNEVKINTAEKKENNTAERLENTVKHKSIYEHKLNDLSKKLIDKYALNDTELKIIGIREYLDKMDIYNLIKKYCEQLDREKELKKG